MLARIFLAFFLIGTLLESVRGTPLKRDPPAPPTRVDEFEDEANDDLLDDMVFKPKSFSKDSKHPLAREKRLAYIADPVEEWPKVGSTVNIPYTSGIDDKVLQRAIEVFKSKTCIRFVPRNSESDYVSFNSGSSCSAPVGYRENQGEHSVSLSSGCASKKGKVMHEMMHVLSFMHEHCRPDRDSYVTVHEDNMKPGASGNFLKQESSAVNLQNIAYDCDSILHYKGTYASSNGEPTITSTHCSALGNGDTRLSLLDYKRVNTLYDCAIPTYTYFTVRVQTNSGYGGTGTDCFIYLTLHGSSLTSTEFELELDDAGSSTVFHNGADDTFSKMAYRNNLGSITGISIRMVSNGWGEAWWPDSFTVTDPVNNQVNTFTSNQWLSPSSTYGTSNFPLTT